MKTNNMIFHGRLELDITSFELCTKQVDWKIGEYLPLQNVIRRRKMVYFAFKKPYALELRNELPFMIQ